MKKSLFGMALCKDSASKHFLRIMQLTLLLLTVTGFAFADMNQQKRTVTGTVLDDSGEPVIGANIVEKGTTNGITTDVDGNFTLTVGGNDAVLKVSYIGYAAQEVPVGNQSRLTITLREDTQTLEEVVVVGYGTVRKSDLTGAVVSLSNEKFKNLPQSSPTTILQGKAAGVNITSTRGDGETTIRVRGVTSLNKSSEPLWVVDGVIGAPTPNFYEIQSIEVLKDASSTAIYGSQGANGVILVTTKRPQEGAAKVTFDTRFGWNTLRKAPEQLDAYEFAQAYGYAVNPNAFSEADMAAFKAGDKGIDWVDTYFRTGFTQSYNLNVTGGSAKTKYGVTASVNETQKQVITVSNRSFNVKLMLDTEITPWMNFSGYLQGRRSNSHNGVDYNEFAHIIDFSPVMSIINETTGIYNKDPYNNLDGVNPYARKHAQYSDEQNSNLYGFGEVKIKLPVDGLTFSSSGYYTVEQSTYREVNLTTRGLGEQNNAQHRMKESMRWRNVENLTYQKQFGDHRLTATAAMELTKYKYSLLRGRSRNFDNEEYLGYWVMGDGTAQTEQEYTNSAMASFFGRVVYSYKGKYSFTGTYRADAPSQFVDKYAWGYFPSAGVAWNISEEDFFNKDMIQQLKLRVSVGTSGNSDINAYTTMANLTRDRTGYGTSTPYYGMWPNETSNRDLRWEKTLQYNAGLDLSLLDQRVSITTDWYLKKTTDLLFRKPLPYYNGGGTIWTNQGAVDNSGWELTLNLWPVRKNDLVWETNFTTSYSKMIVKDLAGVDRIIPDNGRGGANQGGLFVLEVGKPIGTFYIQEFAGFDEQGRTLHYDYDKEGNVTGTTYLNKLENKRVLDKNSMPNWTFGFNNSLTWKNWDFNVFFRATGKYYRLNQMDFWQSCKVGDSRFISSRKAFYLAWDRVADKSNAKYASLTNPENQAIAGSTKWLENAQFLRCQNLSIGYLIPKSVTKFADVHLSISGQNLFVLSRYTGLDPETVSEMDVSTKDGYFDTTFGLDSGGFPVPRTYTFIARFNF